eukprot:scaffold23436_cov68-Phaeocystis_antarctica.AAC.5
MKTGRPPCVTTRSPSRLAASPLTVPTARRCAGRRTNCTEACCTPAARVPGFFSRPLSAGASTAGSMPKRVGRGRIHRRRCAGCSMPPGRLVVVKGEGEGLGFGSGLGVWVWGLGLGLGLGLGSRLGPGLDLIVVKARSSSAGLTVEYHSVRLTSPVKAKAGASGACTHHANAMQVPCTCGVSSLLPTYQLTHLPVPRTGSRPSRPSPPAPPASAAGGAPRSRGRRARPSAARAPPSASCTAT